MIDERLEFEISQLADGTLAAGREASVRALIASDPDALATFKSYEKLAFAHRLLPAPPAIDWHLLSSQISSAIDAASDERNQSLPASYPMPWLRRAAGIAIAASVALAVGVGVRRSTSSLTPPLRSVPIGRMEVAGPAIDSPAGAVIRQITIGPSPSVASAEDAVRYGDSFVVSRPQRVVIASGGDAAQDTNQDSSTTPY